MTGALWTLWLALAGTAGAVERRYAVVVGDNVGGRDDPPLRYAEIDARRMADLLVSLGQVPPEDLVQLLGVQASELTHALGQVGQRMQREREAGDKAVLILYYSGHASADALHLAGSELPMRGLLAAVEAVPADLRVLVLDACQSGDILRLKGGSPAPAFEIVVPQTLVSKGTAILTSSAAGEDAQESDRLQGGVFSHHLLTGLAGAADSSRDSRVTLDEVYRYTYGRTLATTSKAPVVQHPSYSFNLEGQDDIALTELAGARRTGRLRVRDAGLYVILDPTETRLVAEADLEAGAALALAPGTWKVLRRTPDRVYEGQVTIAAGQESALDPASLRVQPYGQSARRGQTTTPHTAIAALTGGGAQISPLDGWGGAPTVSAGLRADLRWGTFIGSMSYSQDHASNEYLDLTMRGLGLQAAGLRMADLGRITLGAGLEGGALQTTQTFTTTGDAPSRLAWSATLAPLGRAEVALSPRWSLGLRASAQVQFTPTDVGVTTSVSPQGGADVLFWLW